jgi:MFS family permease
MNGGAMGGNRFLRENAPWLAAGGLLTLLSSFGQTFYISLFAGEIRGAFGLSHGDWGAIYMLGTLASAGAMVFAGALTDRYRVRALGAVVLGALVVACLLMATVGSVAMLIVVIFALRFTGQGMASHMSMVAMARWFMASRGKAVAVSRLDYSLGEAFLPIVVVSLMVFMDWRMLWLLSALAICVSIPLLLALLRRERLPAYIVEDSVAAGMEGRHWRREEVLRLSTFLADHAAITWTVCFCHRVVFSPGASGRSQGMGPCGAGCSVSRVFGNWCGCRIGCRVGR